MPCKIQYHFAGYGPTARIIAPARVFATAVRPFVFTHDDRDLVSSAFYAFCADTWFRAIYSEAIEQGTGCGEGQL